MERGLRYDRIFLDEAWNVLCDNSLPASMTEDPRFLELRGFVASNTIPPKLGDARSLFTDAFKLKHEPNASHLRAWYRAENESGIGFDQCMLIADFVANGKKYTEFEKLEFLGKKGTTLFVRAKHIGFSNPDGAVEAYIAALKLHLILHRKSTISNNYANSKSEEYSINTAYQLFDFLIVNGNADEFFHRVLELCSTKEIVLDPLEEPLIRALRMLSKTRAQKKILERFKGRLEHLRKELIKCSWDNSGAKGRVDREVEKVIQAFSDASQQSDNTPARASEPRPQQRLRGR